MTSAGPKGPEIIYTLPEMFEKFAKYEDPKADGKTITLSKSDRWMTQAELIGRKITLTDTGVAFNKFKRRTINFTDFEKYLKDIAIMKNIEYQDLVNKLTTCGLPGLKPGELPAQPKVPKKKLYS